MGNNQLQEVPSVLQNLIDGLTTDGAHHKQFYLERALVELVGQPMFNEWKEQFQWDSGIPG